MGGAERIEVCGAEPGFVPEMVMEVLEQHPCSLGADTEGKESSGPPPR